MEASNGGNGHNGMEKLVGKNYKYWRMCMEAYLQGQDLWELVAGTDAIPSEIDADEKISEARLRRYLVRGLKKEYGHFVTSIQGWLTQPSVEELENLLSNQEALAKQMAKSFETDDEEEWIIDLGYSHHVTGNDTLFSEVHEHHGDRVIVTADNSTHPIAKEGVVKIDVANDTSSVKLHDVYHVPGLTKNLVSVPQITDSGKYVLFGPKDVKVLDNVKEISADVIFSGEKKGSLFVMSAGEAYVKKTSQIDNAAIWHARLGHVGYQLLQQISFKMLVDGMPTLKNVREDVICQGCQYGKSHRLPFKRSSNQRSTLFELVHTDLIPMLWCSRHRYVMVLVDDHSRFTWVKFFKEKSEALSKFMEFKSEALSKFMEFKDAIEKSLGRR
ncbi:hypothetical protein RJ639_022112 [Escallonia herrerae]|uniref:GAG-pre-integrase domain-containing protein n=1 Tax=Escallonia herrerae TaxID=1293975 RepID=A0AA88V5K3_9ASTE|nr:hypothetical protein RJ639_022112 [Escallonia herrerae]